MENMLGRYIVKRREDLGITPTRLAEITGMPLAYLSQIEAGTRKWPQKYIPALADALHVPEMWLALIGGKISIPPELWETMRSRVRDQIRDAGLPDQMADEFDKLPPIEAFEAFISGGEEIYPLPSVVNSVDAEPRHAHSEESNEPLTEAEAAELAEISFIGLRNLSPRQLRAIIRIVKNEE